VGAEAQEQKFDVARWYLRAALSEFRSIFDLLNADPKSKQLEKQWNRSSAKAQLDADPIVSVLRKVRDFAVHSGHVRGIEKNFSVVFPGSDSERPQNMPSIVIDPIDRGVLAAARGKDELSKFSDDDLKCFNTQARHWPADLLVHIAIYRSSIPLRNFLATTRKRDVV
jgi:hypothetical protein